MKSNRKLKNNELLLKYTKILYLIEYFTESWMRWVRLLENAQASVDTIDNINLTGFDAELLDNYREYYENAIDSLDNDVDTLTKKITDAEEVKSLLFAEICRRNLNNNISRFKEVIENRIKFYHCCVEGDL